MLRASVSLAPRAPLAMAPRGCQQTRGLAVNPNDILKRITSTKSIEKITKSMKMVSAAKLRGDTQRLMDGRPFSIMMDKVVAPTLPAGEEAVEPVEDATNPLYVLVSSDRGLCGGVNSFVSKRTKVEINSNVDAGKEPTVFVIGEKGAGQIARSHPEYVVSSVDENWKTPINFAKACNIAQRVLPAAVDSKNISFVYNEFRSAVAYETTVKSLPNFPKIAGIDGEGTEELPAPFDRYEIEPDVPVEFLQNVYEYTLACQLYASCLENATSEQSARMTAMDNATKNANEMIDSLTVLYNRARQARITTELIEIISGAESLKG